ncbi:hypothetical protein C0991_006051 [Blastosporella zonata]|nr:hypothetical protein C0991_006051 [Blastosporella zonata]
MPQPLFKLLLLLRSSCNRVTLEVEGTGDMDQAITICRLESACAVSLGLRPAARSSTGTIRGHGASWDIRAGSDIPMLAQELRLTEKGALYTAFEEVLDLNMT